MCRGKAIKRLREKLGIPAGVSAWEHCYRVDGKVRQGWRIVVTDLESGEKATEFVQDLD